MASRKLGYLCELWPEELVAMTCGRMRLPQIKTCMRHILSFYDDICDSVASSLQNSPDHPQTIQKTAKRTGQVATISTKKKNRGEKSQETTSKKATSTSVVEA